jgi:hypothetical protein
MQALIDCSPTTEWQELHDRFLAAVPSAQRADVARALDEPQSAGRGLRVWLEILAAQQREPPVTIARELVDVYLDDPNALPQHDCADCGLAVPVRPSSDGEGRAYFPRCPGCGGPTGRFAYWSNPRRHTLIGSE